jgi:hypothetical protein
LQNETPPPSISGNIPDPHVSPGNSYLI